jgi:hypothetical protein
MQAFRIKSQILKINYIKGQIGPFSGKNGSAWHTLDRLGKLIICYA